MPGRSLHMAPTGNWIGDARVDAARLLQLPSASAGYRFACVPRMTTNSNAFFRPSLQPPVRIYSIASTKRSRSILFNYRIRCRRMPSVHTRIIWRVTLIQYLTEHYLSVIQRLLIYRLYLCYCRQSQLPDFVARRTMLASGHCQILLSVFFVIFTPRALRS